VTVRTSDLVRKIREDLAAREPAGGSADAGLRRSSSLAAVNRGAVFEAAGEIRSHRRWLGRPIVAAKTVLRRFVLAVLEPYLLRERELFVGLVRFDNEVAERVDGLAIEVEERARELRAEIDALRAAVERRPEPGGGS
jgi:hypothetical protein